MENAGICITMRKDGRYMGKFVTGYGDDHKAQYQYVYGKTYEEAENKALIGHEIASRFLSGRYITVSNVYVEWLNAVVNRVKESTLANYKNKFEKHILPEFRDVPCADLTTGRINAFINKKLADGLSASYVRDIFTVFKTMLKYAQEEYGFRLSLKTSLSQKPKRNR
ncbi:N-terminal phage integrase SAM-like domain-containing protein [Ruminococcus sp.]|uniref:N-terminal phage integrase SAM-like domain-containing protein n=1 Tax=Ruminococcus sp. TaxID=41978 RepID=UPI0025E3D687|nr:N-terminal phage integrase SAM-like domain-containing protein [Ruminococcus sp.]